MWGNFIEINTISANRYSSLSILFCFSGWRSWSLSQLAQGETRAPPWTGRHPVTGLTHTATHSCGDSNPGLSCCCANRAAHIFLRVGLQVHLFCIILRELVNISLILTSRSQCAKTKSFIKNTQIDDLVVPFCQSRWCRREKQAGISALTQQLQQQWTPRQNALFERLMKEV